MLSSCRSLLSYVRSTKQNKTKQNKRTHCTQAPATRESQNTRTKSATAAAPCILAVAPPIDVKCSSSSKSGTHPHSNATRRTTPPGRFRIFTERAGGGNKNKTKKRTRCAKRCVKFRVFSRVNPLPTLPESTAPQVTQNREDGGG